MARIDTTEKSAARIVHPAKTIRTGIWLAATACTGAE
jgi:hypothetical protein